MFCFLNSNAKKLRKPGLLPEAGQGRNLVEEQLRDAFLSPSFNGRCTVPGKRWADIQTRLLKEGLLKTQQVLSLTEIHEAECQEARLAIDANI